MSAALTLKLTTRLLKCLPSIDTPELDSNFELVVMMLKMARNTGGQDTNQSLMVPVSE